MFSLNGLGTSGMMKTRFPFSLLTSTGGPGAVQVGIALSVATFEATAPSRTDDLLPADEFVVVPLLPHAAVKTSSAATPAAIPTYAFIRAPRCMPASSYSSIQRAEELGVSRVSVALTGVLRQVAATV